MNGSATDYQTAAVGFLVACGLVVLLTPAVSLVAWRAGLLDRSREERRLHATPTPRLGGIAILLAILVPSLALGHDHGFWGTMAGAVLMTLLGVVDDVAPLPAGVKLGGQVAIAIMTVANGVEIQSVTLPVVEAVDFGRLGAPLTVLWIVAIVNIVNFIDGMDGLAAGFCGIAATTFAILAASLDRVDAAAICAIVAGASFGFLRYNFHPASIFMGDSGSLMLGYLLATLSIQGVLKTAAAVSLAFPLVVLGLPILDTSFVILKRLKYGRPVYRADAWHLHHRFADIGYGQRRTALLLYGWCLTLSAFALAVRFVPHRHGWDVGTVVVLGLFGAVATAASAYVVVLLEIVKLRRLRGIRAGRGADELPQRGRAA